MVEKASSEIEAQARRRARAPAHARDQKLGLHLTPGVCPPSRARRSGPSAHTFCVRTQAARAGGRLRGRPSRAPCRNDSGRAAWARLPESAIPFTESISWLPAFRGAWPPPLPPTVLTPLPLPRNCLLANLKLALA